MVLMVYNKLPVQVPMQWGVDGNVVRYDDKYKLFFVAGLNILIGIWMPILPKIDPKNKIMYGLKQHIPQCEYY